MDQIITSEAGAARPKQETERSRLAALSETFFYSAHGARIPAINRMLAAICIGLGVFAAQGIGTAEARPRGKSHHSKTHKPRKAPTGLVLKPAKFSELPDWKQDKQWEAVGAFSRTCDRMLRRDGDDRFKPGTFAGRYKDWQAACKELSTVKPGDSESARKYFETWFRPWLATVGGAKSDGLFTGYYQATLNGSRVKTEKYHVPLHKYPGKDAANYSREQILDGKWPHNKDEDVLVWVDDEVSAYFLHVQGSGQVFFEDGTSMYIKYDGDNKKKFHGVCLELMKREIFTRDTCSLQAIRNWTAEHKGTKEAKEVLDSDPSYVFFRENLKGGSEGGEGVTLTPERSLAIDYTKMPYGMPLYVNIENPIQDQPNLRRLMIGQDTGGAIRGAIRGDFFWGAGSRAEFMAGRMKSSGGYWMLLPKELGSEKSKAKKTHKAETTETPAPGKAVAEGSKTKPPEAANNNLPQAVNNNAAQPQQKPVAAAPPPITDPVDPAARSKADAKQAATAQKHVEQRDSAAHGREHKARHRVHAEGHRRYHHRHH